MVSSKALHLSLKRGMYSIPDVLSAALFISSKEEVPDWLLAYIILKLLQKFILYSFFQKDWKK